MNTIEEIWKQGNEKIDQDNYIESDLILKSITESSRGITAGLSKPLRFGVVIASMAVLMFIYNAFFYWTNTLLMISILLLLLVSVAVIIFLWSQIRLLRGMDRTELNLHDLLIYKIKYLNTRYNWSLHCVSLSMALATFTINLSIESGDGIFELRKILILSAFYIFAYLFTFGLMKLSLRVVEKQLKNALFNLEEQTLRSLDGALKKHQRVTRIIAAGLFIIMLIGIAFMLFS